MQALLDIAAGLPGLKATDPFWKLAALGVYLLGLLLVPAIDIRTDRAVDRGLNIAESWLLVGCLLAMLGLAGYNVAYRNVLVPLQNALERSAPAAAPRSGSAPSTGIDGGASPDQGGASASNEDGGFAGGFGGGAGAPSDREPGASPDDDDGGEFRGGFGGGGTGADERSEPAEKSAGRSDSEESFEGGFVQRRDESREAGAGAAPEDVPTPAASPEESGRLAQWGRSTAAAGAAAIRWIKLSWIDVLLRHLVLVVGFLGGLLAVRRREHITVDAVGRSLDGSSKHWVGAGTSLVAAGTCTLLVAAGLDLVELSIRWPQPVLPGLDEWMLQLMFPVGFGLMGVRFAMRAAAALRCAVDAPTDARPGNERSGGWR